MIQRAHIEIESNCQFNGSSHYRIQMTVPGEIGDVLHQAALEGRCSFQTLCTSINGMFTEIYDCEIAEDELQWGSFIIEGYGIYVERQSDGSYSLSMTCMKMPEGDDWLDWFAFDNAHAGKLPDNFWIMPAMIIRKLIAAVKH